MSKVCDTCFQKYSHGPSLSRHYKVHPDHKNYDNSNSQVTSEAAAKELLQDQTPLRRHARLKKVLDCCTTEELNNVVLPALANNREITVINFFQSKCKLSTRPSKLSSSTELIFSQLRSLLTALFTEYPNCNTTFTSILQSTLQLFPNLSNSAYPVCPEKQYTNLSMFIDDLHVSITEDDIQHLMKKECALVAKVITEANGGSYFKEVIMPKVMDKYYKAFLEFGAGIVTCCNISHAMLTNVLRNFLGKQLANDVFGVNIILPRDPILQEINECKKVLESELGLDFIISGKLVAGFVNVEKTIRWLLSRPGLQEVVNMPNDALMVCDFTDEFPLLSTSRFSTGECSIDIKLVEPHNFLNTKFTAACWLGKETEAPVLGGPVYKQLRELKTICHPITNKVIKKSYTAVLLQMESSGGMPYHHPQLNLPSQYQKLQNTAHS
jgi:hypothetical protein